MFSFRRKNKFYHQDRIAMRIASRYGLTYEYKLARRHRLSPIDALEDWDMMKPEDYKLLLQDLCKKEFVVEIEKNDVADSRG